MTTWTHRKSKKKTWYSLRIPWHGVIFWGGPQYLRTTYYWMNAELEYLSFSHPYMSWNKMRVCSYEYQISCQFKNTTFNMQLLNSVNISFGTHQGNDRFSPTYKLLIAMNLRWITGGHCLAPDSYHSRKNPVLWRNQCEALELTCGNH